MTVQMGLCPDTVWHSDSKERLGKFRVLRHGVQYVQFCCIIVIITVIGGVDMPQLSQSLRTNASTCVLRDDRITVPR